MPPTWVHQYFPEPAFGKRTDINLWFHETVAVDLIKKVCHHIFGLRFSNQYTASMTFKNGCRKVEERADQTYEEKCNLDLDKLTLKYLSLNSTELERRSILRRPERENLFGWPSLVERGCWQNIIDFAEIKTQMLWCGTLQFLKTDANYVVLLDCIRICLF